MILGITLILEKQTIFWQNISVVHLPVAGLIL
jgi:hypothetical protein